MGCFNGYWKQRRKEWKEKEKCCQIVLFKECVCLISSKVELGVCLPFLIGWGCSGVSNKVELTVECLPSDWLEATQVTGFVLIQIFETFSSKEGEKGGGKGPNNSFH